MQWMLRLLVTQVPGVKAECLIHVEHTAYHATMRGVVSCVWDWAVRCGSCA